MVPSVLASVLPLLISASLRINQIGYEVGASKIAVLVGDSAASFTLTDSLGESVFSGTPISRGVVADWGTDRYWNLDFSSLETPGTYVLRAGTVTDTVAIGENLLFNVTARPVVGYFRAMRSTDAGGHTVSIYGRSGVTRDAYGGWMDASGDGGRYLSHQSTANYMNPQQIPLVTWALMKSWELDSGAMTGYADSVLAEAAWGADFLLRMLDPDSSFFYMNVFNRWGQDNTWYLCSWVGRSGDYSSDYQSAWREGGGMAVAALARAARLGIHGDSSAAQYLAGAERAWKMLTENGTLWADDHRQNLLDDYCALLADVELYRATGTAKYLDSATGRATGILSRQRSDGWWAADDSSRPYYSASDEGLPAVALLEYRDLAADRDTLDAALRRNLAWYRRISFETENPYDCVRMYRPAQGDSAPGKTAFFMPHGNETGYWWQGENARIASLATAFSLASRTLAFPDTSARDTLRRLAQAQLDWIVGKNPVGISFMYGFGRVTYPDYNGHANVRGGICNGITSDSVTELKPVFNPAVPQVWDNWRWVEQWIPHDAWWLLGVSAGRWSRLAAAADSTGTPAGLPVHPALRLQLVRRGTSWALAGDFPEGEVQSFSPAGRLLWRESVSRTETLAVLPRRASLQIVRFVSTDGRRLTVTVPGL